MRLKLPEPDISPSVGSYNPIFSHKHSFSATISNEHSHVGNYPEPIICKKFINKNKISYKPRIDISKICDFKKQSGRKQFCNSKGEYNLSRANENIKNEDIENYENGILEKQRLRKDKKFYRQLVKFLENGKEVCTQNFCRVFELEELVGSGIKKVNNSIEFPHK